MDITKKKWETMYTEEDIAKRVKELGAQITEDYNCLLYTSPSPRDRG